MNFPEFSDFIVYVDESGHAALDIHKDGRHQPHENLYHIALQSCLEELYDSLASLNAVDKTTHVVFEQRGKNEDQLLELEFRRISSGENRHQRPYPFMPIMASKKANSTGLQFADLFARPIGLANLRPDQANRTYKIIRSKQLDPVTPLTQGELNIP